VPADAEGARLAEQHGFEVRRLRGVADHGHQEPRAALLHLPLHDEHVERAGREQPLRAIADEFGGQVIEVRFEYGNGVGFRRAGGVSPLLPDP
jgi:hypothetical protein